MYRILDSTHGSIQINHFVPIHKISHKHGVLLLTYGMSWDMERAL